MESAQSREGSMFQEGLGGRKASGGLQWEEEGKRQLPAYSPIFKKSFAALG